MRTDRNRWNRFTQKLLDAEKLLEPQESPTPETTLNEQLEAIMSEARGYAPIQTSNDLDYFLQLSMMLVTAKVRSNLAGGSETRFASLCTLYDRRDSVLVLKPCAFEPGRCSVGSSSLLLGSGSRGIGLPGDEEKIGLSGKAFRSGRIVHCSDFAKHSCPLQIHPQDLRSQSALCIPLGRRLDEAIQELLRSGDSQAASYCCQDVVEIGGGSPAPWPDDWVAVLTLESESEILNGAAVRQIVTDPLIRETLSLLSKRLADYFADRPKYEVLRSCTSLFQLSQHELRPRPAYEALLREISELCDGADVTLHFRDLFDSANVRRCLRLVAGFGRRFRPFLINERYGGGLVGKALQEEKIQWLTAAMLREISAKGLSHQYHRLMPGTVLEVAVPIFFKSRAIGVLNVEWDLVALGISNERKQTAYLEPKKPLLTRLAAYLSLIIDYFDDEYNEGLAYDSKQEEERAKYFNSRMARRETMAYYVQRTLDLVDKGQPPKAQEAESSQRSEREHWYLEDIVNAVGYLLAFENSLRILVSVRALRGEGENRELVLAREHGLRTLPADEARVKPIPLRFGESVLASCATLGVPIFGSVVREGLRERLVPAELCKQFALEQDRAKLEKGMYYQRPADHPVLEVAIPLVFGPDVIGTFDFEQFSIDSKEPAETKQDRPWKGYELVPFLEWARAITFCMMYARDRKGETMRAPEAYHRFQMLCALIIANVAIQPTMFTPFAQEYFRALLPGINVEAFPHLPRREGLAGANPSQKKSPPAASEREANLLPLWHRGRYLGEIRVTVDGNPKSIGANRLVERFVSAFYTATFSAESLLPSNTQDFKNRLRYVEQALGRKAEALSRDASQYEELDAARYVETLFGYLHEALSEGVAPGTRVSRYGWHLYLARSLGGRTRLRSGQPRRRWASMKTHEMSLLVDRVHEGGLPELERILEQADRTDLFRELRNQVVSLREEELEEIFHEALFSRDYDYPQREPEDGNPSLTRRVAWSRKPMSVVDLNRSPFRSPRRTGWFFQDASYSIITLPIVLGEKTIGVLHITRRRRSISDFEFFKKEEIEAAENLCKKFEKILANEVEVIPLWNAYKPVATSHGSTHAFAESPLERALQGEAKIILLESDSANTFDAVQHFCHNNLEGFELIDGQRGDVWKPSYIDGRKDKLVAVSFSSKGTDDISQELRLGLRALMSLSRRMVLLLSNSDKEALYTLLPEEIPHVYVRQPKKSGLESLRQAAHMVQPIEFLGLRSLSLLVRRSGPWSLQGAIQHCEPDGKRSSEMLSRLEEEPSFRLFPEWLTYHQWQNKARA